jgi:hypothetical protein
MVVAHREDGVRLDGQRVEASAIDERLASLGQDGWELVAVTTLATDYRTPVTHGMAPTGSQDRYVFKRPLPQEPTPDVWAELRELLVKRERRKPAPDVWAELRELLLDRERNAAAAALDDPPLDGAEG